MTCTGTPYLTDPDYPAAGGGVHHDGPCPVHDLPGAAPDDRYHDAVAGIVEGFRYELCGECHRDLDRHAIVPGVLGLPFALCLDPPIEDA